MSSNVVNDMSKSIAESMECFLRECEARDFKHSQMVEEHRIRCDEREAKVVADMA